MKKLLPLLAFALAVTAHADTFTFSYTSIDFTGAGTFSADLTSTPGQYLINTVTGSVNGVAIAGLIPADPSTSHFEDNDNLLFVPPSPGYFDLQGVSFQLANSTLINLFYDPTTGYGTFFMVGNSAPGEEDADVTIVNITPEAPVPAVTPEPSSLMLLGTGTLGLFTVVRRRFAR